MAEQMSTAGLDLSRETLAYRAERVVELTRGGRSAADIAWILGVSARTVSRYREKLGISHSECRRERTSEDVLLRAKCLLVDGASYREVARTLGIHRSTVAKHLPGYGWTSEQTVQHGRAVQMFNAIGRYLQ